MKETRQIEKRRWPLVLLAVGATLFLVLQYGFVRLSHQAFLQLMGTGTAGARFPDEAAAQSAWRLFGNLSRVCDLLQVTCLLVLPFLLVHRLDPYGGRTLRRVQLYLLLLGVGRLPLCLAVLAPQYLGQLDYVIVLVEAAFACLLLWLLVRRQRRVPPKA